ncbi:Pimelyl-[acyl-carrier protein] methyl ester esterase [Raoultella terrigena]|uniref:Pimelyl-[acyl-carrier protein] methyl ester esterase n=1 Tax=Raoultella terrigena TaxID=577 RepID=A0A3P8LXY9_RAOTE|nr:Pimelyl-[acyl-carrier protein] methyl ester esterase [Raoultella terrigena]
MPGVGLHYAAAGLALHAHVVDLPGYGRSSGFGAMSLEEMAQQVLEKAPEQAIWLGWSLGAWWQAR